MTPAAVYALTVAVGSPDEQIRRVEAYACGVRWPPPRPPRPKPERKHNVQFNQIAQVVDVDARSVGAGPLNARREPSGMVSEPGATDGNKARLERSAPQLSLFGGAGA